MPKIKDFRQRATDCLDLSERSPIPRHKELFLRMAQTWLSLAERETGSEHALDGEEGGPDPSSQGAQP